MTTVFLSSKFIFRRLCTFTLRKLFTLLTLNINSTRSRERRNVVLLFVFVKVLYQCIFCRIILRRLSGRVKLRKLRMSLKYTLYLYLKSSVNTWQVCFQRTHILNKTHISKWGLNEPLRFENRWKLLSISMSISCYSRFTNNLISEKIIWRQLNRIK